jgi:hypothetical protein
MVEIKFCTEKDLRKLNSLNPFFLKFVKIHVSIAPHDKFLR